MNVSRRWLEDFLRRPLETRDVVARLGMLGAPVELASGAELEIRPRGDGSFEVTIRATS